MWDTGNGLLDPIMKEPVHVMAKEDITYFFKNGLEDEKIRLIPYHSVGKPGGVMMAVVIDKMVIREQGKNDEIHRCSYGNERACISETSAISVNPESSGESRLEKYGKGGYYEN